MSIEESDIDYYASAPHLGQRTTAVVEQTTGTAFIIEGHSTTPSDFETAEQTHKVLIALIDLQTKLEWISAPKIQATTFLRVRTFLIPCFILPKYRYSLVSDEEHVTIRFPS